MLVIVFMLRIRLLLRQKRERAFAAQWQPLLAECVFSVPAVLPRVPKDMGYHFLKLWNFQHESLAGSVRANLESLGTAMQLEEVARRMMHSGNLRERLMAVITLGHLKDRTQWHELRALVSDPSPVLSLAAARALLDIDSSVTLPWMVTVMAAREDWPLARVVMMLKEVGPDRVTFPLVAAGEAALSSEAGGPVVVRLLRMMEVGHLERVSPVAVQAIRQKNSPEVIAAALRLISDPRELGVIRELTAHEVWFVRAGAVRVLGGIGDATDRSRLVGMLSDAHWWVRYRAARALLALPGARIEDIEKVRDSLDDPYAADMLSQVVAEARS